MQRRDDCGRHLAPGAHHLQSAFESCVQGRVDTCQTRQPVFPRRQTLVGAAHRLQIKLHESLRGRVGTLGRLRAGWRRRQDRQFSRQRLANLRDQDLQGAGQAQGADVDTITRCARLVGGLGVLFAGPTGDRAPRGSGGRWSSPNRSNRRGLGNVHGSAVTDYGARLCYRPVGPVLECSTVQNEIAARLKLPGKFCVRDSPTLRRTNIADPRGAAESPRAWPAAPECRRARGRSRTPDSGNGTG